MSATPPLETPFRTVPERNTADVILRTAQQHHVQLSAMADVKANIIITVSSIVLTVGFGRTADPELQVSSMILVVFTMLALLLAVLAVLPKYRPLQLQSEQLPPNFNLLFFGHFAELTRDRFLAEVSGKMKPDGSIYETMCKDLYGLGYYLSHYKYRYLRLSYLFFLTGFVLATLVQVAQWLWR